MTAAQIAELRRMVAEPTTTTYSDVLLQGFIARYPLMDELQQEPYTWTMVDGVYSQLANTLWIPTYDLNAAAADVWEEKLASLSAVAIDFNADGGNYSDSQAFEHAEKMVKRFRGRRCAKNVAVIKWPKESIALTTQDNHVEFLD
ncbi:MAG: hypothetical protein CVU43_04505 [Chloroflexi bacterium HGW-Chloroflexi-5]|nr:MAG: hypothetical protein CVU43_04505 [Chloroflexi bacterium HGW-Chloroflexi-5]